MRPNNRGRWRSTRPRLAMALALLLAASCSETAPPPSIMDAGKVASVIVGRSSRTDVFNALGQPSRTERSGLGEAWVYQAAKGDAGNGRLVSGASAASGIVGAFVPYAGLVGSGLGLAGAAADRTRPDVQAISLTVTFRDDGLVRDCSYASTALPAGVPGSIARAAPPIDCSRPVPGGARTP